MSTPPHTTRHTLVDQTVDFRDGYPAAITERREWFQCRDCGETFKSYEWAEAHQINHARPRWWCRLKRLWRRRSGRCVTRRSTP